MTVIDGCVTLSSWDASMPIKPGDLPHPLFGCVWMEPYADGIEAKMREQDKTFRLNNRSYTFTSVKGQLPDHVFTMRWCLYCRRPHPVDVMQHHARSRS